MGVQTLLKALIKSPEKAKPKKKKKPERKIQKFMPSPSSPRESAVGIQVGQRKGGEWGVGKRNQVGSLFICPCGLHPHHTRHLEPPGWGRGLRPLPSRLGKGKVQLWLVTVLGYQSLATSTTMAELIDRFPE